jgi:hypothetical protein
MLIHGIILFCTILYIIWIAINENNIRVGNTIKGVLRNPSQLKHLVNKMKTNKTLTQQGTAHDVQCCLDYKTQNGSCHNKCADTCNGVDLKTRCKTGKDQPGVDWSCCYQYGNGECHGKCADTCNGVDLRQRCKTGINQPGDNWFCCDMYGNGECNGKCANTCNGRDLRSKCKSDVLNNLVNADMKLWDVKVK